MSRPTRTILNASIAGWVARFEGNAAVLLDGPLPIVQYADETAINADKKAVLNADCLSLVNGDLYTSDASNFVPYRPKLTYIAPVNPATVLLSELKDLYNDLLADMQSKGYML